MEGGVASQRCMTMADLFAGLHGAAHSLITQHRGLILERGKILFGEIGVFSLIVIH